MKLKHIPSTFTCGSHIIKASKKKHKIKIIFLFYIRSNILSSFGYWNNYIYVTLDLVSRFKIINDFIIFLDITHLQSNRFLWVKNKIVSVILRSLFTYKSVMGSRDITTTLGNEIFHFNLIIIMIMIYDE